MSPRSTTEAPLPTGPTKTAAVRSMFDTIAPRYDLVNRIMTLGLDQGWRRPRWPPRAPEGSVLLDLACGTGDLSRIAVRDGYRVIGADLSMGMLTANSTGLASSGRRRRHAVSRRVARRVLCGYALRNSPTSRCRSRDRPRRAAGGGSRCSRWPSPSRALADGPCHLVRARGAVLGGALSDETHTTTAALDRVLPKESDLRQLLINAGFATVTRRLLHGA